MELSTKQFRKRNAILECLKNTQAHPSAETLFHQLKQEIPDLSMGTVYRNLTLFKKQGLAASVATVNGVERFDGNTDPHVHFVCGSCNSVLDLPELDPPESLCSAAAKATGGQVTGCQLIFTGTCQDCLNQE